MRLSAGMPSFLPISMIGFILAARAISMSLLMVAIAGDPSGREIGEGDNRQERRFWTRRHPTFSRGLRHSVRGRTRPWLGWLKHAKTRIMRNFQLPGRSVAIAV